MGHFHIPLRGGRGLKRGPDAWASQMEEYEIRRDRIPAQSGCSIATFGHDRFYVAASSQTYTANTVYFVPVGARTNIVHLTRVCLGVRVPGAGTPQCRTAIYWCDPKSFQLHMVPESEVLFPLLTAGRMRLNTPQEVDLVPDANYVIAFLPSSALTQYASIQDNSYSPCYIRELLMPAFGPLPTDVNFVTLTQSPGPIPAVVYLAEHVAELI